VIESEPGSASSFRVALTIDAEFADRPTDTGATARLLDVLAEDGIPAAVFVQGRWASGEPALARRIVEDGHLVGNHSHHHARMTMLTGPGIVRDVREAEQAILDATGVNPRPWFRCRPRSCCGSNTCSSRGGTSSGWTSSRCRADQRPLPIPATPRALPGTAPGKSSPTAAATVAAS
jgi:peptidoglycan/xylan/chitin deacetylase (PgdA/CDA1 family)